MGLSRLLAEDVREPSYLTGYHSHASRTAVDTFGKWQISFRRDWRPEAIAKFRWIESAVLTPRRSIPSADFVTRVLEGQRSERRSGFAATVDQQRFPMSGVGSRLETRT